MKIAHIWLVMAASVGLELCLAAPLANNRAATGTTPHHVCPCKKRSAQFLIERFNDINSNANCFNIEMLPIPARRGVLGPAGQNTTLQPTVEAFFSTLSVDTNCLSGLRQSTECFAGSFGQCSWAQQMEHTGDAVFPQFEMHAACNGCNETDRECQVTHNRCYYRNNTIMYWPLERGQRCDQDGYEIWRVAGQRSFNAACSCVR